MGIWGNFKSDLRPKGYGDRQYAPFRDHPHEPLIVAKNQKEFDSFVKDLVVKSELYLENKTPFKGLSPAMLNYFLFLTGFKGKTAQLKTDDGDLTLYNKVSESVGYSLKAILDHDIVNGALINNHMARHTPFLYPSHNPAKAVKNGKKYTKIDDPANEWEIMVQLIFELNTQLALNAYQNVVSFWESTGLIIKTEKEYEYAAAHKFCIEIAEGRHKELPHAINRVVDHSIPLINAYLGSRNTLLQTLGAYLLNDCLLSLERIIIETEGQGQESEALIHYRTKVELLEALEQKYGKYGPDEYGIKEYRVKPALSLDYVINLIRQSDQDSRKTLGNKIADVFRAVAGACWRFCKGCGRAIASPFIYIANKVRGNNELKEPVYGYGGHEHQRLDVNYGIPDSDRLEENRGLSDDGRVSAAFLNIPSYAEYLAQNPLGSGHGASSDESMTFDEFYARRCGKERDQSSRLQGSDSVAHEMHIEDERLVPGMDKK